MEHLNCLGTDCPCFGSASVPFHLLVPVFGPLLFVAALWGCCRPCCWPSGLSCHICYSSCCTPGNLRCRASSCIFYNCMHTARPCRQPGRLADLLKCYTPRNELTNRQIAEFENLSYNIIIIDAYIICCNDVKIHCVLVPQFGERVDQLIGSALMAG